MKKTKRKAVINLIIFFLLLAGGIYMAIAGVGAWRRTSPDGTDRDPRYYSGKQWGGGTGSTLKP